MAKVLPAPAGRRPSLYSSRMADSVSSVNPDASSGAATPRVGLFPVNGTSLYAEVRGSGPAVLLIGAADEDAEVYRAVAERLTDRTVVTYDRRGTLRSGREDWPGGGSGQHADDAAALIEALGLGVVVIFGASAGGVVGLQVALRHPRLVRRALLFEPGYLRQVSDGEVMRRRVSTAVERHLTARPGDWAGAVAAMGRVISSTIDPLSRGFFAPPAGKDWYAERMDGNAEAFIRGDLSLTGELVDEAALAAVAVDVRFSFGTTSLAVFREVAERLAAVRGETADRLEGVGHASYFSPAAIAAYIQVHSADTVPETLTE